MLNRAILSRSSLHNLSFRVPLLRDASLVNVPHPEVDVVATPERPDETETAVSDAAHHACLPSSTEGLQSHVPRLTLLLRQPAQEQLDDG